MRGHVYRTLFYIHGNNVHKDIEGNSSVYSRHSSIPCLPLSHHVGFFHLCNLDMRVLIVLYINQGAWARAELTEGVWLCP